jgi:TPR repeat protein
VNPDYTEALYWFRRAAALGNPSARYSLAGMYETGRGAAQDNVRAYMWLDFASSTGWKLAVNAKNKLAKRMSPDQIVEARRMYLSCLESSFELCD